MCGPAATSGAIVVPTWELLRLGCRRHVFRLLARRHTRMALSASATKFCTIGGTPALIEEGVFEVSLQPNEVRSGRPPQSSHAIGRATDRDEHARKKQAEMVTMPSGCGGNCR